MAEAKTLKGMLETALKRFAVERVIIVADRGLRSMGNVAELGPSPATAGENCSPPSLYRRGDTRNSTPP